MITMKLSDLEAAIEAARDDVEAAHEAANALNVEFWGEEDADLDECIERLLDDCAPGVPDDLVVVGARRMEVSPGDLSPDALAEDVYERLDDEYNCGGESTRPTPAVIEAARAFLAVVKREYVPWNCEEVVTVTLDAEDVRRKLAEFWPEQHALEGGSRG